MKVWQKLDIGGRVIVLGAAAVQIFLVVPMANFDFSVFWFDSVQNQIGLMEIITDPEMDYDNMTRIKREFYESEYTSEQYSGFHKGLQKFGSLGSAGLFFVGSAMLILSRVMEFNIAGD